MVVSKVQQRKMYPAGHSIRHADEVSSTLAAKLGKNIVKKTYISKPTARGLRDGKKTNDSR